MIESADVIIVEGILILYDQELRNLFDMKLFVDADSDDRLARRVQRDTQERGRSLSQVNDSKISYLHLLFAIQYVMKMKYFVCKVDRNLYVIRL